MSAANPRTKASCRTLGFASLNPAYACALLVAACATLPAGGLQYPATARAGTADDYFGTRVADPYRWLEDLGSAETRAWVEAQNALSRPLLAALPARGAIR